MEMSSEDRQRVMRLEASWLMAERREEGSLVLKVEVERFVELASGL